MVDTTSSSYSCIIHSSEEEEDMANCLIMLAHSVSPVKPEKLKIRSVTEMAAGENPSFQNYECKTCNRAFPSFQALGGHRASHKKPKLTVDEENNQPKLVVLCEENKTVANKYSSPATPDCYKNSQTKVHQCSICGSEFLSGQALGGHMRRHRTISPTKAKPKSPVLSLDLNLPPPEVVDDGHSSFQFFSAAALVDCHY